MKRGGLPRRVQHEMGARASARQNFHSDDPTSYSRPQFLLSSFTHPNLLCYSSSPLCSRFCRQTTRIMDATPSVLNTALAEIASRPSSPKDVDCCVICLESISEPAIAEPCQHRNFDFLCLLSWFERNTTCPLCKADVRSVRYASAIGGRERIYDVPKAIEGPEARDTAFVSHSSTYHRRRHGRSLSGVYPSPDHALLRRRHVYQDQLYSFHVGSNRVSRYRELTPQLFKTDPELQRRARMWMRRELRVFECLYGSHSEPSLEQSDNAEFVLLYTMMVLKSVDMQGSSGAAVAMLSDYLGRENAQLFFHELRNWLRSPYTTLEDWDRNVQYGRQTSVREGPVRVQQTRIARRVRLPSQD